MALAPTDLGGAWVMGGGLDIYIHSFTQIRIFKSYPQTVNYYGYICNYFGLGG